MFLNTRTPRRRRATNSLQPTCLRYLEIWHHLWLDVAKLYAKPRLDYYELALLGSRTAVCRSFNQCWVCHSACFCHHRPASLPHFPSKGVHCTLYFVHVGLEPLSEPASDLPTSFSILHSALILCNKPRAFRKRFAVHTLSLPVFAGSSSLFLFNWSFIVGPLFSIPFP